MSDDSDSKATTTQVNTIPSWATDASKEVLNRGQAIANTPYQAYTGQRIAGLSPEQTQGFGMMTNIATNGTGATNAAEQNYTDMMSGNFLSPGSNPYLKANVDRALSDVQGRVNSQFNNANYGTTAHQETLARSLGETASNAYGENYSAERRAQTAGQAMAPAYQSMAYGNANALTGVGDAYRQEAQTYLNQQLQDWQDAQNHPYKQLDVLGSALKSATGGQGSQTTTAPNPYQTNKYAGTIGGATAGYAIGNQMGGYGGYGAALGGLAGLLG